MSRHSRAATNAKALESAIERMGNFTADGIAAFDRASARALTQADRGQLAKAKDLFARNAAMMKDLAVGRRQILEYQTEQTKEGVEWAKRVKEFLELPAFANEPKAAELVRAIEHADGAFKQARLVFWVYLTMRVDTYPKLINDEVAKSLDLLKVAQDIATEPSLKSGIGDLLNVPLRYQKS
jgi:hypothetical protein